MRNGNDIGGQGNINVHWESLLRKLFGRMHRRHIHTVSERNETHAIFSIPLSCPAPISISWDRCIQFFEKAFNEESSSSSMLYAKAKMCASIWSWRWKLPLCYTHMHTHRHFSIQIKWLICWLFNFHPLWLSNIKAFRCFSHFAPQHHQRIAAQWSSKC